MINEIIYDGLVLKTSCRYFDVKAGNTDSLVEDNTKSLMTLTFRPGSTNESISKFLGIKKVGATQELYATSGPKLIKNTTVTLNGLKLKKLTFPFLLFLCRRSLRRRLRGLRRKRR